MELRVITLIAIFLLSVFNDGMGQEVINLYNPSFEDQPQMSRTVNGWNNCGFLTESPPDVQPGIWEVDLQAYEGNTYLGMVTRDNDTWESVSQRLVRPLNGDKCYSFSLFLASEDHYISISTLSGDTANYNAPITLRIYGGNGPCDKAQLLAESDAIKQAEWKQYNFKLEPNQNYSFIILEAFYDVPVLFPQNGNILIDNLSEIRSIPCDKPLVAIRKEEPSEKPKAEKDETEKPSQKVTENQGEEAITKSNKSFEPKHLKDLNHKTLEKGQVIKIEDLHFKPDSTNITEESEPVLDEIYTFLKKHNDVKIEIGGHTNSLPPKYYCMKLSRARAASVAAYLIKMGIDSNRISYRGYGKKNPVASNKTEKGRMKNQRCEIKIVSIDDSVE